LAAYDALSPSVSVSETAIELARLNDFVKFQDDARQELLAERDAARAELAARKSSHSDLAVMYKQAAEVDLPAVRAEVERLREALEPQAFFLPNRRDLCGRCSKPLEFCDRECFGAIARRALAPASPAWSAAPWPGLEPISGGYAASPGLPKPMDEGRDSTHKNLLDQPGTPFSGLDAKTIEAAAKLIEHTPICKGACMACAGAFRIRSLAPAPPDTTPSLPKESGGCQALARMDAPLGEPKT
jgi:hypothetical protein